jgi:hypothetical protein
MNNQKYVMVGNQQNPLDIQTLIKNEIQEALKHKASGYDQKNVKTTWFNPEKIAFKHPKSGAIVEPYEVYEGIEGYEGVPPWNISNEITPIMNAKKFQVAQEKYAKGSVSSDFVLYNHISKDYQEKAKQLYSQMKYALGSVITSGDFAIIKQAQMLVNLVNNEERTYTLDQSFNTVQSSDIIVDIDTYHRFQLGAYDKGELETVDPLKGSYETQRILMRKAMGSLEWSDESMMMPWRQNVMGDHLQNLTSDFRRIKVEKIATEFTSIATETTGGGSLLAFDANTERSTVNPFLLIGNAASEIDDPPNYGMARIIAMHPTTWRKFLMNSWGRSLFSPVGVGQTQPSIIQGPRGLEDFTIYLDKVLPTGKIWIIDPTYAYLIQGPVMTENVRDSARGANGVIMRDWHRAIFVKAATQGRFITAT